MKKEVNVKTVESADIAEETVTEKPQKAAKKSRIAVAGAKKGAIAARHAAAKVAAAPGKLLDKALYGACYGISYGVVFSSLMVEKVLPKDGTAMKGFHEGAEYARKDFKNRQKKHISHNESAVVH